MPESQQWIPKHTRVTMSKLVSVMVVSMSVLVAACAPPKVPVRMVNMTSGEKIAGHFLWTGAKGFGQITMPDGVTCDGEYLTEFGGSASTSWGTIYHAGGVTSASSNSASTPNTQRGSAIIVCPNKRVIDCEYVVNRNNHGSGYCNDNEGNRYRLMH